MALESASYINGLVSSNPAAGDPVTQADDHLRLIKAALLGTFPNLTGPVTATQGELNNATSNFLTLTGTQTATNKTLTSPAINTPTITGGNANGMSVGVSTAAPGRFTTLEATGAVSFLPAGFGGLWYGTAASCPTGWRICDGTNGTPDMRGIFLRGATGSSVGATGGSADAVVVAHTHTGSTSSSGDHDHDYTYYRGPSAAGGGGSQPYATTAVTDQTETAGAHTHTVTVDSSGVSGTNANLPPYREWHFIIRA